MLDSSAVVYLNIIIVDTDLIHCMYKMAINTTPASNLGYLAPPQDNFSWVPNCSLGPPGWETKVSSKKFWFGLCEIAWFLCQPIANLRRGVCL